MSTTLHDEALRYLAGGLSMVPTGRDKRPFNAALPRDEEGKPTWRPYQEAVPDAETVAGWFRHPGVVGVAVVCGKVSGGVQVLDFDEPGYYERWCADVGELADGLPVQRTQGGGYQVALRCDVPDGNTKLAHVPDEGNLDGRRVAIETRGEGGYAVLPGSHGPEGVYVLLSGDFADIPIISEARYRALLAAAAKLDEAPFTKKQLAAMQAAKPKPRQALNGQVSVIDAWNQQRPIRDVLTRNGYRPFVGDRLTRPGNDASSGGVVIFEGKRSFHHSSNDPLNDGHAHDSFSVFCGLEHGGDVRTAVKAAAAELGITLANHRQNDAAVEADATRPLPRVIVTGRPTEHIAQECIDALAQANDPPRLFRRSGGIVRLDRDEEERPVVRPVELAHLRHEMARACRCVVVAVVKGEQRQSHVPPPKHIAEDISAHPALPFPALAGIVEAPVLRPDGAILDVPGYDAATKLNYSPAAGLFVPPIPESPTPADARAAVAVLHEAIGEFPFADAASYANAIAAMLTPVIRQAIGGHAPLCIGDAPCAGTGKSLLFEATAIVATGRASALMMLPREDAELEKRITTAMSDGATVINIDNVDSKLWHPSLSAALTRDVWECRLLGGNRTLRVPQRATWLATGNNIRLGGDIPRRCYWVRLDSRTMRPWERRGFRHPDLLGWVRANRGRLLAALLTMARAWFIAGKPASDVQPIGSFEPWCRTVGGILELAGVAGFLENIQQLYEVADDDTLQWAGFLRCWFDSTGTAPVTIGQVCRWLEDEANKAARDALPEHLGAPADKGFAHRLGNAIRTRVGRRFDADGLRVERAGADGRSKSVKWRVLIDEPPADAGTAK